MTTVSRLPVFVACALLSLTAAAQSGQQAYPNRAVRMVAPSSAGGPVDVIARVVAQGMTEALGQQIVIDNRAGAAGLIGAELVAKAPPDGYTLLFGFSAPLAIVPNMNDATPYDTLKDFAPISLVASAPYVLIVHPSVPAKTVKELVALARSRPGKLNYASGGTGTGIHLAGELFNLAAGVRVTHVPYKGAGPGMTALISGEVEMMFNGLSPVLPFMKTGKLRALAVGGEKRSALLPGLPTIAESGLKFHTSGWYVVLAPRATPQPIIAQLHAATVRALKSPEAKDRLNALAVEEIGSTPEELTNFLREEMAKWGKVVKAAGLKGKQADGG